MKTTIFHFMLINFCMISTCSERQTLSPTKTLIVYLSRTNIKNERAKEAETKVKKWLRRIKITK